MNEISVETVRKVIHQIQALESTAAESFYKLGILWKWLIEDTDAWRRYASHIERKDEFIREMGRKPSTVYLYIAIAKHYGPYIEADPSVLEIGPKKLQRLLPYVRNADEETTEELINKAKSLPEQALDDELREMKGRQAHDACEHDMERWLKCKTCGKFIKEV